MFFFLVVKTSDITHKKKKYFRLKDILIIILLRHVWFSLLKPQKGSDVHYNPVLFIYYDHDLKWFRPPEWRASIHVIKFNVQWPTGTHIFHYNKDLSWQQQKKKGPQERFFYYPCCAFNLLPSAGHRNKFHKKKKVTDCVKLTEKRHVIHHTTLQQDPLLYILERWLTATGVTLRFQDPFHNVPINREALDEMIGIHGIRNQGRRTEISRSHHCPIGRDVTARESGNWTTLMQYRSWQYNIISTF